MTVPQVTLLSVWEQSSSSTSDNNARPASNLQHTYKSPQSSAFLCLLSPVLFLNFFASLFLALSFSYVFAPLALIAITKSTFLMLHACMWLCSSMALLLCGVATVVCNYSSTVCSAKDFSSPWEKGVPVGAPGPSRRGFGLCGCVIMPIPLVSICVSCCLFGPI